MIKLYSPTDTVQLAMIESIFQEENIPYFIQGNHYGAFGMGLRQKTIMINEEDESRAKELLADYLKTIKEDTAS